MQGFLVAALLVVTTGDVLAASAGIPNVLSSLPGDPARGRAIVVDRRVGMCLLCHSGPFPEERQQGDLAPSLAEVGKRLTAAEMRSRLLDPLRLNPASIMPAYARVDGLWRVAPALRDKSLLTLAQIEDVVAFLVTLQ
jgi:sulfur-oxidizing protein SoxX